MLWESQLVLAGYLRGLYAPIGVSQSDVIRHFRHIITPSYWLLAAESYGSRDVIANARPIYSAQLASFHGVHLRLESASKVVASYESRNGMESLGSSRVEVAEECMDRSWFLARPSIQLHVLDTCSRVHLPIHFHVR